MVCWGEKGSLWRGNAKWSEKRMLLRRKRRRGFLHPVEAYSSSDTSTDWWLHKSNRLECRWRLSKRNMFFTELSNRPGWKGPKNIILCNLLWERKPGCDYLELCRVASWKPLLMRALPHPWDGRSTKLLFSPQKKYSFLYRDEISPGFWNSQAYFWRTWARRQRAVNLKTRRDRKAL